MFLCSCSLFKQSLQNGHREKFQVWLMVMTRVKVIDIPDVAHCYASVEEMSPDALSLAYLCVWKTKPRNKQLRRITYHLLTTRDSHAELTGAAIPHWDSLSWLQTSWDIHLEWQRPVWRDQITLKSKKSHIHVAQSQAQPASWATWLSSGVTLTQPQLSKGWSHPALGRGAQRDHI